MLIFCEYQYSNKRRGYWQVLVYRTVYSHRVPYCILYMAQLAHVVLVLMMPVWTEKWQYASVSVVEFCVIVTDIIPFLYVKNLKKNASIVIFLEQSWKFFLENFKSLSHLKMQF